MSCTVQDARKAEESNMYVVPERGIYHLPAEPENLIKNIILKHIKCSGSICDNFSKRELSYTAGGNVNWRTVRSFLKKLKAELPYDPPVPLLCIYLEKNMV